MSCIWTEEKLYELVKLYSKFSNLWDRHNPQYDNLRSRHTSYSKILQSLSMPTHVSVSNIICKLKELRTIYVSEVQKIEGASRVGRICNTNHTWFQIMHEFLYDHLDADEKLAGFSSSEDSTASSEEALNLPCKKDSSSSSESESDISVDRRTRTKEKKTRSKQASKSQAYFVRSPTILRSTKMNTKYEYPSRTRASSITRKDSSHREGNSIVKHHHETQQCTQLDVTMTASDVSIKYLRTEIVNGEAKSYKKNLKGRLGPTDKPQRFKNVKMIISKSGSTVPESKDRDTELWQMMSMLDLDICSSLTEQESRNSPKTTCCSVSSADSMSYRNFLPTRKSSVCCASGHRDDVDGKDVTGTQEKPKTIGSCCSKETKDRKNCEKVDSGCEPCLKTTKVVCLGDETLFDNSLLELLTDLSIKICPVDGGCASGNCPGVNPDDVSEGFLPCWTCSSATKPIKDYPVDEMKENGVETPQREVKSGMNLDSGIPGDDEVEREKIPAQQDYDVNVALESAGVRSLSKREDILHAAKKELWEASKLYNSGKFITNEIVSPGSENESADFDSFGTQVATSLKMMGKQRAMKLKQKIAETLSHENGNEL